MNVRLAYSFGWPASMQCNTCIAVNTYNIRTPQLKATARVWVSIPSARLRNSLRLRRRTQLLSCLRPQLLALATHPVGVAVAVDHPLLPPGLAGPAGPAGRRLAAQRHVPGPGRASPKARPVTAARDRCRAAPTSSSNPGSPPPLRCPAGPLPEPRPARVAVTDPALRAHRGDVQYPHVQQVWVLRVVWGGHRSLRGRARGQGGVGVRERLSAVVGLGQPRDLLVDRGGH